MHGNLRDIVASKRRHTEFETVALTEECNEEVLIILGRPFLATGGAIIDVREGKLKMRVDDEEVTFNVYKALKLPKHYEDLCMINVVKLKEIEKSSYVNYSGPDGTTKLEEVVLQVECVRTIEKRAREERGDLLRACKKAKTSWEKEEEKMPRLSKCKVLCCFYFAEKGKSEYPKLKLRSMFELKCGVIPTLNIEDHVRARPERDFNFKSLNDLEDLFDKKLSGLNIKPIDLSKDFADKLDTTFDYKNEVWSEFNKLRGYPKKNSRHADKPRMQTYYYDRPTPQDVLIEERDWNQTNTSYSGFTGQLRGWWDNYLTADEKLMVINVIATDEGIDNLGMALVKNREDDVYTFILTILEYFNGRFTNQHEIVRTLLNGLRCRTLGEFRLYKDIFMSRIMELPENKYDHWKAKFIDGLPSLFAERVRKTLRGSFGEISYKDYTYGKQLKMDKLKERKQLGDFCTQFDLPETPTHKKKKHKYHRYPNPDSPYKKKRSRYRSKEERDTKKVHRKSTRFTKNRSKRDLADIRCYKYGKFGHIAPNCKLQKLKTLELDNELRDKVYGMLYTSGEVENLKREIKSLKQNQMICDHRITQIEKINSPAEKFDDKNKGISENDIKEKPINTLPYEDNFSEDNIPTKSRPCQMNAELVEFCKKVIDNLLQKGLIKPSKSPWSCTTFYVNNVVKKEHGIPRLVINYKPLNKF
ncbi:uncharacterized protein [Nicotiana tomentosiformis]|uniref:uncharacterized protein n=1 Tax=Nicotiana tomentosiformis TaxID=4098 RepID=UPI00388CB129